MLLVQYACPIVCHSIVDCKPLNPPLSNFMDGDREEMVLYLVRATRRCLSQTDQRHPTCSNVFIFTGRKKKCVIKNTIPIWLRSVISKEYKTASDSDCIAIEARACEVRRDCYLRRTMQSSKS